MTAYNPPSSIYFNGIEFNPSIIEQGDTISGGGNATLAGNNTWTGTNNFNGSITMTTQAANNNSTLGATTAYVDNAISGVGGVSLTANNTFTGLNTFSGGINVDTINGTTGTGITIDTASLGTTFEGQVFANNNLYTNEIDGNYLTTPATLYIGQNYAASILIGTDVIPVTIGYGSARPNIANIQTVNMIAESIDLLTTGYINSPNIYNSSGTLLVGNATTSVNLLGIVTAPTQTAGNNTTRVATTAFVTTASNAIRSGLLTGTNTWSGANSFTGSINVTTQTAGNNTTLVASTAFVTSAISALSSVYQTASQVTTAITSYGYQTASQVTTAITSYGYQTASQVTTAITSALTTFKSATNSWTGANNFTGGSIIIPTQTAGDNSPFGASTAFVTSAISALSSIYQTASQVSIAISSALTTFLGTANMWTADQDLSLVNVLVKTQLQSVSNNTSASTAYTSLAVTNGISTGYANIMANTNNYTGVNTFTNTTYVTTAVAGTNTTQVASTAFVTSAISALSSVYQTASQVTTAITSALTTFKATANTFTANQIFPTIQFSSGTLNQAFFIQHVNSYAFGAVTANTAVTQTFSYSTLGMTNYTTFITAQICNSSSSAQGNRVLFSIQAQSASSFTIVGFNVTATNTSASAFSLVVYGR